MDVVLKGHGLTVAEEIAAGERFVSGHDFSRAEEA
jgi:hypothetical protein